MPRRIFNVQGRVVHASGEPAEGAFVALVDADPDLDDLIAVGCTTSDGTFRASFTSDAFNQEPGENEAVPDLYAIVSLSNGGALEPALRHDFGKRAFAGVEDLGTIRLPPPFSPFSPLVPLGETTTLRVAPGRGKVAKRVRLDDELVEMAVKEVAPMVERLTGWSGLCDGVRFVLVDDFLAVERRRHAHWLERTAFTDEELASFAELARECEANKVAEWIDHEGVILLNRPLIERQSFDLLKLTIGHDLVHVGQSRAAPEQRVRHDEWRRRLYREEPMDVETRKEMGRYMANLEGYAHYIETRWLGRIYTHGAAIGHATEAADRRFRAMNRAVWTRAEIMAMSPAEIVERFGSTKAAQYASGAEAYAARCDGVRPAPFDKELRPEIVPDWLRLLELVGLMLEHDPKPEG